MSNHERQDGKPDPPYIDNSLVINSRLSEIERQQRAEQAERRKHESSQRKTNWLVAVFTGLLFITSTVSDVLSIRQTQIAKEAADAAKLAFHVSERAYVVAQGPRLNPEKRSVEVVFQNVGHIPSGEFNIMSNEVTFSSDELIRIPQRSQIAEIQHYRTRIFTLAPGPGFTFGIPIYKLAVKRFNSGRQSIVVAGRVSYKDGFPDDVEQGSYFCYQSRYQIEIKLAYWDACDPNVVSPYIRNGLDTPTKH